MSIITGLTVLLFDSNNQLIGLIHIVRNITDRKKAEEEKAQLQAQLLHSQKMETVGILASSIAHEFNNILTGIIGYGSLLQEYMEEGSPLLFYVRQILTAAGKASDFIKGLLAFSRKQIINWRPVNLNELVGRVEKILIGLIGENIELKIILTDEDLTVMADCSLIEQVLLDLAINARDAIFYNQRA